MDHVRRCAECAPPNGTPSNALRLKTLLSRSMDVSSADLLARWQQGDEAAAAALYARYAGRLHALARRRLTPQLARRLDPDDVVQSACRSFFTGARAGRYVVRNDEELWRLLA